MRLYFQPCKPGVWYGLDRHGLLWRFPAQLGGWDLRVKITGSVDWECLVQTTIRAGWGTGIPGSVSIEGKHALSQNIGSPPCGTNLRDSGAQMPIDTELWQICPACPRHNPGGKPGLAS